MFGTRWIHIYVHIRPCCGEIPNGKGIVTVEQIGNVAGVGNNARHVGGSRERANLQRSIRVLQQLLFKDG